MFERVGRQKGVTVPGGPESVRRTMIDGSYLQLESKCLGLDVLAELRFDGILASVGFVSDDYCRKRRFGFEEEQN